MEITCYRDPEIRREKRTLPATTYNLAIKLLARCETKQLFIPIRSMQYMAIVDAEEFVFVDSQRNAGSILPGRIFTRTNVKHLISQ